ncbi:MAG: helix-turn-helix domain-containing protein, partial [Anaerolineales bacterium]|nr:helix-turn-helix domain-containing protein [Anaerolineales bacterium]
MPFHQSPLFSSGLSGRWNPSFENLENLCRVLECTADDIMVYDP